MMTSAHTTQQSGAGATYFVGEEAGVAEVLESDRDTEGEEEEEATEEEDVGDVMRSVAAVSNHDATHVDALLQQQQ